MFNNNISIFTRLVILLLFCSSVKVFAEEREKPYELNAFLGIGYNRFISGLQEEGLNKNGFNGTLRIMWSPEYLLRVGLETGYVKVFSVDVKKLNTEYGKTYLKTNMSAIPIFIIWSMDIGKNFEINIGTGGFLLYSTVDSFNNKVTSTEFSSGYIISLTYLKSIFKDLDVGIEIKWDYINKIGNELRWDSLSSLSDGNIIIQLMFKYNFLEW